MGGRAASSASLAATANGSEPVAKEAIAIAINVERGQRAHRVDSEAMPAIGPPR